MDIRLETERLVIIPLTFSQLVKYAKNDSSLEEELKLNKTIRTISPELIEALEVTFLPNVSDPEKNYLFSTLWTIILKDQNKMIGDLCFVGEPNENGEVEIGYGTHEEFRGNGYMVEAVKGLIHWAADQPKIKAVIASTDKNNIASCLVLEKNHFIKTGEKDNLIAWRVDF
jgi:RimJ/RimL family protein N-acetyltransferase